MEKLALDVITGGGVGFGKIERGERAVDIVIEGDGGLGGAGFGEHGRGVIAEGGVGMDLLHESGEVSGRVVLADGLVEGDESVLNGARAFAASRVSMARWPAARRSVSIFSKAATSGLEAQIVGWETVTRLGGKDGSQKQRETEQDCQACGEQHERASWRNLGWNDFESILRCEEIVDDGALTMSSVRPGNAPEWRKA